MSQITAHLHNGKTRVKMPSLAKNKHNVCNYQQPACLIEAEHSNDAEMSCRGEGAELCCQLSTLNQPDAELHCKLQIRLRLCSTTILKGQEKTSASSSTLQTFDDKRRNENRVSCWK